MPLAKACSKGMLQKRVAKAAANKVNTSFLLCLSCDKFKKPIKIIRFNRCGKAVF